MPLYPWLLSALLIGQAGGEPAPSAIVHPPTTSPVRAMPDNGGAGTSDLSQLEAATKPTRATPDQLVGEALAPPLRGPIGGQPLTLLAAIAPLSGRPHQLEAVHAYWRLVQAVGDYHYSAERQQRLARLTAAANEGGDLRTAQAAAAARLQEAEIRVAAAQHELAAAAHLAESGPLPWPADRPLTEGYRTRFAEMFAGRKPPERTRMLDQTLPLRQRAVQSHAAAVLAAEESLDAALELHAGGQGSAAAVLRAIDAQVQQQRAFLAAVCRYNEDIADYALTVVPSQTATDILVTTLIKPVRPVRLVAPGGSVPAGYQEPLVAPPRAPGRVEGQSAIPAIPAIPAAPPARVEAQPSIPPLPPATVPAPPENGPAAPRLAPPAESAIPLPPEEPPSKGKSTDTSTRRSTFKPVVESGPADPAEQTARLVDTLYDIDAKGDSPVFAANPEAAGTANWSAKIGTVPRARVRLADCLRSAPANRRMEAIDAYWAARQAAAFVQMLAGQSQWLAALRPALAAQNPPSPTGLLSLRSAQSAVEARLADAEADRVAADFQLALAAGLPTENGPPRPTSMPVAGHFSLSLQKGGRAMQPSWPLRQAEAELPRWEEAIGSQCAAVREAEAARTAAAANALAGRAQVEQAIAAIDVQAGETAAFLQGLSDYNRAIARYVALRLGPSAAAESVVAAIGSR